MVAERRAKALAEGGHKCRICAATSALEVHHNTYERLGHERPADLIVLCRSCHKLFHDNSRLAF
jgi:5-methylcytosine-specific restriction endonuclease McrA